jgi:hypothetical protein
MRKATGVGVFVSLGRAIGGCPKARTADGDELADGRRGGLEKRPSMTPTDKEGVVLGNVLVSSYEGCRKSASAAQRAALRPVVAAIAQLRRRPVSGPHHSDALRRAVSLSLSTAILLVLASTLAATVMSPSASGVHDPADSAIAAECIGCHTAQRQEPINHFPNGLGRWTDGQCYGCHAELNDVAAARARGVRDARYFAVPVTEQKLASMVTHPLAYMNAPEHVEPPTSSIPRLSVMRLAAFLRRPANLSPMEGSRAPRMMAYPALRSQDLQQVGALMGINTWASVPEEGKDDPQEAQRIEQLWTLRCASCHGGDRPVSGRSGVALGLYTPEWIYAYANGKEASGRQDRRMPVLALSREDALRLYRFLGAMRTEAEQALDTRVARLELPGSKAEDVPDAFVTYLWDRFFRDATCVHCHATSPRAASAFRADAQGLKEYLRRKSGQDFWRRLEIRQLEAEHGLVASTPGMPMAGVELPAEVRKLVGQWVRAGCRAPDGQRYCPEQ